MRTKNTATLLLILSMIIGSAYTLTSIENSPAVFANHEFSANLTGQDEVPPVDTQTAGEIIFVPFMPKNETIEYYLNAPNLTSVTQGHIHSGVNDVNRPIVVTLFKFDTTQDGVT